MTAFVLGDDVIDGRIAFAELSIAVSTFPVPVLENAFTKPFASYLWTEDNEVGE